MVADSSVIVRKAIQNQDTSGHNSTSGTVSWSFTNTGTFVVVGVSVNQSGGTSVPTINSVTYGGQAMSLVPNSNTIPSGYYSDSAALGFYELDNAPTGSNMVDVSFSPGSGSPAYIDCIAFVISFVGYSSCGNAQQNYDISGSASNATVTVPSTTNGDLILIMVATGTGVTGANSPTVMSAIDNVSGNDGGDNACLGYLATSGGSVTPSVAIDADAFLAVAVEVS